MARVAQFWRSVPKGAMLGSELFAGLEMPLFQVSSRKPKPYEGRAGAKVTPRFLRLAAAIAFISTAGCGESSPSVSATRTASGEVSLTFVPVSTGATPATILVQNVEVTQAQWFSLMSSSPSYFSECGETCPVESVNWWEAVSFANRLSEKEGRSACYSLVDCHGNLGSGWVKGVEPGWGDGDFSCAAAEPVASCSGYRLPTAQEWAVMSANLELGAPPEQKAFENPTDLVLGRFAWYAGNAVANAGLACDETASSLCSTHPVGGKEPANGLSDILGNVSEWLHDSVPSTGGTHAASYRQLRGGSWLSVSGRVRSSQDSASPDYRSATIGFRLVRAAN